MSRPSPLRIAIAAGETSGDMLAADLIRAIKYSEPHAEIYGIAGPRMQEAGCRMLFPMESLAVMGIVEVLGHLPEILRIRRQFVQHLQQNPPDVFIGVDAPDFNLGVEQQCKQTAAIPTVHYNSPTVWAWRRGRLKKIAKATDLMLTLLPFEAAFYEQQQIPVRFVGHPLADRIPQQRETDVARTALGFTRDDKVCAVLPGSRGSEIKLLGKTFIETALWCLQREPDLKFVAPMVNEARYQQFSQLLQQHAPQLPIQLTRSDARQALMAADVSLLVCGTAALEAMLCRTPMVVAYRASWLSYQIGKRLIDVKYISLPNLLADKALVPEFIQTQATPENLGASVLEHLHNTQLRTDLSEQFAALHHSLQRDASEQAAKAILSLIAARKAGYSRLEI